MGETAAERWGSAPYSGYECRREAECGWNRGSQGSRPRDKRTRAFLFGREENGDGQGGTEARPRRRSALRAPALNRARHGRCRDGAISGCKVWLRSARREWLLLRL